MYCKFIVYYSYTEKLALDYADSYDCILIAAAGNSNNSIYSYPAAYENVLAVSATDSDDSKASYSNYGLWVDIAAPGNSIYSTLFNNNSHL